MKIFSYCISIFLLIVVILISMYHNKNINKVCDSHNNAKENINLNILNNKTSTQEMRAIWVPFMSLNMHGTDYSENSFKQKFNNIIDESKKLNINTLIVQVRPFGDALYKSKYFPWSHILTGEQGKDPGFDPLLYMINQTHDAGLEFHAWVNPLRIQVNNSPPTIAPNNPYHSFKSNYNYQDIILELQNGIYYNPGYSEVRKLIIDGIKEIVENYPIDAIQIDDYFYPPSPAKPEYDKVCYDSYCSKCSQMPLSLLAFRTTNINLLISGIYSAIKSVNPSVQFGIAPEANIQNDINMGADVFTWCSTPGYIDYICPQVYVSLNHPFFPFAKLLDTWEKLTQGNHIKVYYGLAAYKAGSNEDSGTWHESDDILKKEIELCRSKGCDGFMFFSFEDISHPKSQNEILNVIKVLN